MIIMSISWNESSKISKKEVPAEPKKQLSKTINGQELVQQSRPNIDQAVVGKMLHFMRWSRPNILKNQLLDESIIMDTWILDFEIDYLNCRS